MILASTSGTLDKLAELADRIMKVGTPSVSACYPPTLSPSSPEIDLLRTEVARLQQVVKSLQTHQWPRSSSCHSPHRSSTSHASPSRSSSHLQLTSPLAGILPNMAPLLGNANPL